MTMNAAAKKFRLILYVTGHTMKSRRAIDNLQRICDQQVQGQYDLTIIDAVEHPEVLERDNITWTPVTIRESPLPKKRAEGDLTTEAETFIQAFDLYPD